MTTAPGFLEIRQLVQDVLRDVSEPYSESIPSTNTVFLRIQQDNDWLRRYHELDAKYNSVNSRIAIEVARQTGQKEINRSSLNKCRLIISETYALLGPKA